MKNWIIIVVTVLALAIGCKKPAPQETTTPVAEAAEAPQPEPAPEPPKPVIKTPENLQAAYTGETNANARYMAFAEAADKEGYKNVGRIFRGAARAEEIHAKKLADLITAAGGTPVAGTATPEVKTTAENVKAALAGESEERDSIYPVFADAAKAEENAAAAELFSNLAGVEAEHAKIYASIDTGLAAWKKGKKNVWVCPTCGNVMTSNKAPCGVCGASAKVFEAVK